MDARYVTSTRTQVQCLPTRRLLLFCVMDLVRPYYYKRGYSNACGVVCKEQGDKMGSFSLHRPKTARRTTRSEKASHHLKFWCFGLCQHLVPMLGDLFPEPCTMHHAPCTMHRNKESMSKERTDEREYDVQSAPIRHLTSSNFGVWSVST